MISVVCIAKDQIECSSPMLEALGAFDQTIRVIDRTWEDKGEGWDIVVRNQSGSGWLAGMMRELGILEALKHNPHGVMLIDGDRIPNCDFRPVIDANPDSVILFYAEGDNRDRVEVLTDVTKACYQLEYSPFYSNCVYVPEKQIRLCLALNHSCFDPEFDGFWGEEDRHFGDRLVFQGATVLIAPYSMHTSGEIRDRYADGVDNRNFAKRKQLCLRLVTLLEDFYPKKQLSVLSQRADGKKLYATGDYIIPDDECH
jgi:hypothetical protein